MHSVLITGANGFIGRGACARLLSQGFSVIGTVRHVADFSEFEHHQFRQEVLGDQGFENNLAACTRGVDTVVHLAALVHAMHYSGSDALHIYRKVNVQGTERLARIAAEVGVRRFIFMSSIKVNGEATASLPFSDESAVNPKDPYAVSKWGAEQVLQRISIETGMEVVILRAPLVYGPGVKANFLRLLRWVDRGMPFPLASVNNRRSMIYLGNLVDALVACVEHNAAAGNTFLMSDGEDVTISDLICIIATAMGKPSRLWNCPEKVLRAVAGLAGQTLEANRLLGSLQIDSSKICRELDWSPPYSLQEGIRQTVDWYKYQ